jgi:hypothetical protein
VLPGWQRWRLREIDRLAVQRWIAEKFRRENGWQAVRNAWVLLEHSEWKALGRLLA